MLEHPLGEPGGETRHGGELGHRGGLHPGEAAEPLQQQPPPVRPHTGDVEQLRRDRPLGAALPVVGQPEAMRLVADALQQPERGAPAGQPQAVGATRQEDLLVPLGEAGELEALEAEAIGGLDRGIDRESAAAPRAGA